MKKAIDTLAAVVLIFVLLGLGACQNDSLPNSGATTEISPEAEAENGGGDLTPYLPEKDYGGYEFGIMIRDHEWYAPDFVYEESVGEVVDEAVYRRQLAVEERFGVRINVVTVPNSGDYAVKSIQAGEDEFDLVLPFAHTAWNSYIVALKVKYSRDEMSVKMLDILKESRVFDFGYHTNYNVYIGMMGHMMFNEKTLNVTSYLEKHTPKAESDLEKLVASVAGG